MKTKSPKTRPPQVKRLIVPTDFSDLALRAMPQAEFFAKAFSAELVLLHVIETFPIDYVVGLNDSKKINAALEQKAQERIRELAKSIGHSPVRPVVRWGKPFREIIKAAKELDADMIVLSTHGYSGLKHVYLGSTAEQVVRHADCTVVVVRP